MNPNLDQKKSPATPGLGRGQPPRSRLRLAVVLGLAVLACAIGYQFFGRHNPPGGSPKAVTATSTDGATDDLVPTTARRPDQEVERRRPTLSRPVAPNKSPTAVEPTVGDASISGPAQEIIDRFRRMDLGRAPITAAEAEAIRQNISALAAQGPSAVPALRAFLARNQDIGFEESNGRNGVGYASLRTGLFDALKQIGGPEAQAVLADTLRTTGDAAEIGWLARTLEEQAPGQYRQEAVNAARDALEQVAKGQLNVKDVAPLFQVFQNYADAGALSDLAKTLPQWNYYATMALAGLPDGQGIPALVEQAQNPSGSSRMFALQMLAQIAAQYPDAAAALTEQARSGQISDRTWNRIAMGLAGDQYQFGTSPNDNTTPSTTFPGQKGYHIANGNQNFFSTPVAADDPLFSQRIGLIDQLLSTISDPVGQNALKTARDELLAANPNHKK